MFQLTRDQAFISVCNIRTPVSDKEKVGTGIFVGHADRFYLITAAHIAIETNDSTYIVCCDAISNPVKRDIKALNSSLNWKYHPVEDLCALEIDLTSNLDLLKGRCFPFEQIENNDNNLSRDFELTCIGFPHGLGIQGKFSPFTFRSFLSSNVITLLRADTNTAADFYCLENPSVGGYSGGPIFDLGYSNNGVAVFAKGPTKLIGIMHGTISDDTGGKIAAITPARFIADLI